MPSAEALHRKDLRRAHKESPVVAGIWIIRNLRNSKILLGSALNLPSRLNRHRFELQAGSHPCAALQADWKALGPDAFVLEEAQRLKVPEDEPFLDVPKALADLEDLWLRRLRPFGTRGYHLQA